MQGLTFVDKKHEMGVFSAFSAIRLADLQVSDPHLSHSFLLGGSVNFASSGKSACCIAVTSLREIFLCTICLLNSSCCSSPLLSFVLFTTSVIVSFVDLSCGFVLAGSNDFFLLCN